MDPGLRLLASRWFFLPFAVLAALGTVGLLYVLISGFEITPTNVLRGGVMLLLSYMALALSLEARRAVD
jgi:uncharacterized membrane protein YjjP (DUF1212 family)